MSHVFPLRKTLPALRRLALVVAIGATTIGAASAQECRPVAAEQFIEQGAASVKSGETKGVVLIGLSATSFAKDLSIEQNTVLAVFLIEGEMLILVLRDTAGGEVACMGLATPAAKAAIERHAGREV